MQYFYHQLQLTLSPVSQEFMRIPPSPSPMQGLNKETPKLMPHNSVHSMTAQDMTGDLDEDNESYEDEPNEIEDMIMAWCEGRMSNLDYLMQLNRLAGRSKGDGNSHPIVPWVIDFSRPDGSWRYCVSLNLSFMLENCFGNYFF
jgi:hypothetical protein